MKTSYKVLPVSALVVGLIALIVAFGHKTPTAPVPDTSLGGVFNVNNVAPTFSAGYDIGSLPVSVNWAAGKIGAKTNSAFWRNTTGQTVFVDLADVATDGTASSSYKIYAYATTTLPSVNYDYKTPVQFGAYDLAINGFSIATSSVATTTWNNVPIQVPNAAYFVVLLNNVGSATCTGTLCETATSTNRGFNLPWRIEYHN